MSQQDPVYVCTSVSVEHPADAGVSIHAAAMVESDWDFGP